MNAKTFGWVAVAVLLLVGIVLLAQSGQRTQAPAPAVTSAPTEQPAEEATPTEEEKMGKNVVTITKDGFDPVTINIKAGETVIWENKSGKVVSINSEPHPTHTDYPPLNLGLVQDGQSVSLVFDAAGTYRYHNHLNASQKGTVIVK